MKRILSVILVVIMIVCLSGCGDITQGENNADNFPTFIEVEWNLRDAYKIVHHKETKVMYVINIDSATKVFTLLVNADGTPMLYESED